jgi:hypothetical protein
MAQQQALNSPPDQRKLMAFVKEAFRARTATQISHFHGLQVDWRQMVDESIECNIPLVMFQGLVEVSVSARSICMNVKHQIEVRIEVDHSYHCCCCR